MTSSTGSRFQSGGNHSAQWCGGRSATGVVSSAQMSCGKACLCVTAGLCFQPDRCRLLQQLFATSADDRNGLCQVLDGLKRWRRTGCVRALLGSPVDRGQFDIDNAVGVSLGRASRQQHMDPQSRRSVAAVSTIGLHSNAGQLCAAVRPHANLSQRNDIRVFRERVRRAAIRRWDLRRLRLRPTGWRLVVLPPEDPRRPLAGLRAGSMASIPPGQSHAGLITWPAPQMAAMSDV